MIPTGKGVLTGLTEISDVIGFDIDERTGEKVPTDGRLYFQGYNVADLIKGMEDDASVLKRLPIFFCSVLFRQNRS